MKRQIAFISEHASPLAALGGVDSGGQNVYVAQVARHLSNLGYQIDMYTRWDDPSMPQIVNWSPGVRVIHIEAGQKSFIPKEQMLPLMDAFTKNMLSFMECEEIEYKLIHAHFFMSGLVAANIKKRKGIPYVITFHALGEVRKKFQGEADHFPPERYDVEKKVAFEADKVIAECPQDREDLINLYDVNPDKIIMIPAGFSPHEFYPIDQLVARNVLGLDPKEHIILQLGRMVPRKGVENVIRGVHSLIVKHDMSARLLIVGGESDDADPKKTPEIKRLLHIAQELEIENHITFVGRRDRNQLKYYYAASDVFVTTPWYEPFGITPLEAMACGIPVVGARVGGIKYSIREGKTGYLVSPENPEELSERLRDILSNPQLKLFFKQNAIERANSLFTWANIAHSMSRLYEEIVSLTDISVEDTMSLIEHNFEQLIESANLSRELLQIPIADAAHTVAHALSRGKKLLACGNGGSATDAQHFVGELVGRFQIDGRKALPALALNADPAIITAWANDYSYDDVYARQVEAHGSPGDIFMGISTSGSSRNIIRAFRRARERGLITIALLGKQGGPARNLADIAIVVPSLDTTRIQEIHINIIHTLCEVIERKIMSEQLDVESSVQTLNLFSGSYNPIRQTHY